MLRGAILRLNMLARLSYWVLSYWLLSYWLSYCGHHGLDHRYWCCCLLVIDRYIYTYCLLLSDLGFETAELVVYDLPYYLIVLHYGILRTTWWFVEEQGWKNKKETTPGGKETRKRD